MEVSREVEGACTGWRAAERQDWIVRGPAWRCTSQFSVGLARKEAVSIPYSTVCCPQPSEPFIHKAGNSLQNRKAGAVDGG